MESKLMYKQGNLFTGCPFGVQVEKPFGSTELHGPFSSENEAWNYGMGLANESVEWESFVIVKIETSHFRSIATAEEIREHRQRETLLTEALGVEPGETRRIDISSIEIDHDTGKPI